MQASVGQIDEQMSILFFLCTALKAGAVPGLQKSWLCGSMTYARLGQQSCLFIAFASVAVQGCSGEEGRLVGCFSSQNL